MEKKEKWGENMKQTYMGGGTTQQAATWIPHRVGQEDEKLPLFNVLCTAQEKGTEMSGSSEPCRLRFIKPRL